MMFWDILALEDFLDFYWAFGCHLESVWHGDSGCEHNYNELLAFHQQQATSSNISSSIIYLKQSPNSTMDVSKDLAAPQHSSANGDFDCNICLDVAMDPIVTLCGHLYCSHCICKWIMFEKESCPVCKASLSLDSLVCLHGRDCRPRTAGMRHRYGGVEFPQSSNSRLRLRGSGDGGVVGGMYYWSRYGRVAGTGGGMTVRRPEVGVERLLRIWLFMICSAALCILML